MYHPAGIVNGGGPLLENKIIDPGNEVGQVAGQIKCRERLGGILKYYYRDAA